MQYLYLIKCQEFYKIGVAQDVESRLAQLSTGNPFPLQVEIVYIFDNAEIVEKALHQKFQNKRQRGEWFSLTYADTVELHSICLMLGASAREYTGEKPTDELIEEAEEIQEYNFVSYDPESMRTELRMQNGEPRGVVVMARTTPKKALEYIGKTHPDFQKYVSIYKQEHPEGIK